MELQCDDCRLQAAVAFDWLADAQVPAGNYTLHDLWDPSAAANVTSPSRFAPASPLPSHAHLAFRLEPATAMH
jgi:hypothetical protein